MWLSSPPPPANIVNTAPRTAIRKISVGPCAARERAALRGRSYVVK
jgi:hypothetical protein